MRDRNLLRQIGIHLLTPSAAALCPQRDAWRSYGTLKRVNRRFASAQEKRGNELVIKRLLTPGAATDGSQSPEDKTAALLSEVAVRAACDYLPRRYSYEEAAEFLGAKDDLARQILLDVAFKKAPGDATAPSDFRTNVLAYVHDLLTYLGEGRPSLDALTALTQKHAARAGKGVGEWYANLAFDCAQAGAWDSVQLLLNAQRVPPHSVNTTYVDHIETFKKKQVVEANKLEWEVLLIPTTTLLHLAAQDNNITALDYLQNQLNQHEAHLDDVTDGHGATALLYATKAEKHAACAWLLEHGASADAADMNGNTPLHVVQSPATAQLLVSHGIDGNVRDEEEKAPLHRQQDPAIINVLLSLDVDLNMQDGYGNTPLFYATNLGAIDLLCTPDTDFSVKNEDGLPLLHYWSETRTPSDFLAAFTRLLTRCTPEQRTSVLQQRDTEGRTLIHHCLLSRSEALNLASTQHDDAITSLRECIALAYVLRDHKVPMTERDESGQQPYDVARALQTQAEDVQRQLKEGPDPLSAEAAHSAQRLTVLRGLIDELAALLRP